MEWYESLFCRCRRTYYLSARYRWSA